MTGWPSVEHDLPVAPDPNYCVEDVRPDPTVPPISWCRIFQVGPACGRLCEDCQEAINRLSPAQRRAIVADRAAP